ncbi:L,D-transpeptidase family protein [Acetobacter orientalis]|uniref:L,D-transpeptidase family protein n=1 Tax=Acetobacter orientalis TaxID=146474 RepID=UPI0039EBD537
MMIHIRPHTGSGHGAQLHCGHKIMSAVIGKNGVTHSKKEGDNATPLGLFPLVRVFYRADRVTKPLTSLPVEALSPKDGWCDDPQSPDYNKKVILPCAARHEKLWREDNVYDIIVVIAYNMGPAVPGRGSAIFMHLQRPTLAPTEGCVALSQNDLLWVLSTNPQHILIHAPA